MCIAVLTYNANDKAGNVLIGLVGTAGPLTTTTWTTRSCFLQWSQLFFTPHYSAVSPQAKDF